MLKSRIVMACSPLLFVGQTAVAKEKNDPNFSEYGVYGGFSPSASPCLY